MDIVFTPTEARVLGVLVEKEITTPDYYPLTLNSVVLACNQKSNREPVTELDENTVLAVLNGLNRKHFVILKNIEGSRVLKYAHGFRDMLKLTPQELGIICVLFLRGAQTPGEINSRTTRLCKFDGVAQVEEVLNGLISRDDGPFVVSLERRPGHRERRYAHLFCGEVEVENVASDLDGPSVAGKSAEPDRIEKLENLVSAMQTELDALKQQFDKFREQFE